MNLFFYATNECFISYTEYTLPEVKKVLNLNFTFSDKFKSYQEKYKPNEKLVKMSILYSKLNKIVKNNKYSLDTVDLIIKIFKNDFNKSKMTTDLLDTAEKKLKFSRDLL